jgi:hypothetical protein
MSAPPEEKDGKGWLIGLAIGVLLALVGPTLLYNWRFNPTENVIFESSTSDETPTPTPSPSPSSDPGAHR